MASRGSTKSQSREKVQIILYYFYKTTELIAVQGIQAVRLYVMIMENLQFMALFPGDPNVPKKVCLASIPMFTMKSNGYEKISEYTTTSKNLEHVKSRHQFQPAGFFF